MTRCDSIRWWERADTRERACADRSVYQVGVEAELQTRDFRRTVLYVVDLSGYRLSAKFMSPAGAAAATKGLQLTPRGWEQCASVAGLAIARLSTSAGLSSCAVPPPGEARRMPAGRSELLARAVALLRSGSRTSEDSFYSFF